VILQVTGENLALPGRLAPSELTLAGGELICLIGPNGSGKTSLLHALAGIGKPKGRVLIDGIDPWVVPPSRRGALLAYLPASREIAWPLIARDLLSLGRADIVDEGRTNDLLALLDLADFADRRVDRLSTGERSRLLLARALAGDPKLLLLDEPTANLDPLWQLRAMDYLKARVRDAGRAVLVALHDLDLARRYADRLIVMDNGRIEADEAASELLAGPHIPRIFGVRPGPEGWEPVSRPEDPRSSP